MTRKTSNVLEIMRGLLSTSVADTLTSEAFNTPVRYKDNEAMLIWDIWFSLGTGFDVGHADGDEMEVSLSDEEGDRDYQHDGLVAKYSELLSVDGNSMILVNKSGHTHWHFDPPLLYAKQQIWFNTSSVGIGTTIQNRFRIGYTIEKVSDQVFIDALTE
ncbi:unnamed protein product [marine sediment metagenome]|uniref:Uncharacterized protein n=1 Tax=marine sediment metagenome TaxID=412755 RepID=X1FZY1_9ZZZZ